MIITRFAPSPTGFLHIGGARTALFNWLYARHTGGKMMLRIEDTDRERSTQPAIDAILDGLRWMGIDWDGEVVYQFARAERHRAVVKELLVKGLAYPCYASAQELEEMRESARREGRAPRYDGRWRNRDPKDAPADSRPVIRLKAPQDGETVVEDQVQGRVVWQNKDLDDLVLLRSDGTPTYMLAVVVDDHDMGITHIIRGDDHFTNAARQTQIYNALSWHVPIMAHIPLIHGPDGAKLSKRHGALGIEAYRAMGFLPQALRNYLVRLGWSHGDQEIFSLKEMVAAFDLPHIGRSAARFDMAKLAHLNGHYLRTRTDEDILTALQVLWPYLTQEKSLPPLSESLEQRLLTAMPGLKERAKTLVELIDSAFYLTANRPLILEDAALALIDAAAQHHLQAVVTPLEQLTEWNATTTEDAIRRFAEDKQIKLGQIAQPLRAALTGRKTSPGLFDVMVVLGQKECLARIEDAIKPVPAQKG
jgi:glutamyl-tRNA synthetase